MLFSLVSRISKFSCTLDKVHIYSFNAAQSLIFSGMSKGQESKFLAFFDLLYSSSGPQNPQHKSSQKFISLSAKNKITIFYQVKICLIFLQGINFQNHYFFQTHVFCYKSKKVICSLYLVTNLNLWSKF